MERSGYPYLHLASIMDSIAAALSSVLVVTAITSICSFLLLFIS